MRTTTIILAAAMLALAGTAFGDQREDEEARLEAAKERLVAGAASGKPSQAARMRGEAAQLQEMIDELEAGRRVDSGDVDRAINRAYQGY